MLHLTTGKELDEEVKRVVEYMATQTPGTEPYRKATEDLKILCDARSFKSANSIGAEVLLGVAANLLGTLLVLNYEQAHVLTSKAIGFLFKRNVS